MKNILAFVFFINLIGSFSIQSQNNLTANIVSALDEYTKTDYPEKVYLHVDKSMYTAGEHIWFSAYLLNGVTHKKSDKSAVLYVELINNQDSIISRKKLFIPEVNSVGDFKLPKKVSPGKYMIRGYTNYSRNEDTNHFFQKEIIILALKKQKLSLENETPTEAKKIEPKFEPDLHFYPEGGYLVNNLKNRVAVKLKNSFFDSISIPITIKDTDGNLIKSFTSTTFGLGNFYLTPQNGKNYYASFDLKGIEYRYDLPKSLLEGYVLNAVEIGQNIFLNIQTTKSTGLIGTSIVVHQRGKLILNKLLNETNSENTLKFPKAAFSSGVVHITLFNAAGKPVSERLVFINNKEDSAHVTITPSNEFFGKRQKVTLNLNVKDGSDQNIISHLSMVVRDAEIYPSKNSMNIKTWLLLNSDIKGKVKNPQYFFENENDKKRSYLLDLILLTNGWRRFSWQNILNSAAAKNNTYAVEKGISISGKTLDLKSPYGIKSVPTRLTFMSNMKQELQKSNSKGEFSYGPYVFFDSIPVAIEARLTNFKSDDEELRQIAIITAKDIKSPPIVSDTFKSNDAQASIDAFYSYNKYLRAIDSTFNQQENVLDEITIKAKLKSKENERNDEMSARTTYGNSFRRFDVEKNGTSGSINAFDLLSTVPGLQVRSNSVFIRSFGDTTTPQFFYDEIPIQVDELQDIFADDISFIDVLIGPEAFRFVSSGSVISMYSKQGKGSRNVKSKPGVVHFKMPGFYTAKEFFSPDHENGIEENTKADVRTTLYWQPNITTFNTKTASFSFFTSDLKSSYIIEVEGITETGIPVYATSTFTVE